MRIVVGIVLLAAAAVAADPPAAKSLTPDQREKLKERDRLGGEVAAFQKAGKLTEAAAAVEKALAIERAVYGDAYPDVVDSCEYLTKLYRKLEDWPAATKAGMAWQVAAQVTFGSDNWRATNARLAVADISRLKELTSSDRGRLGNTEIAIGTVASLRQQGKHAEAVKLAELVLTVRRELLGDAHPDTAAAQNSLANVYQAQGRLTDAEPLFRDALGAWKKAFGDAHPITAMGQANLAGLCKAQGRLSDAEPLYKSALAVFRKAHGDAHPATATVMNNLALLYTTQGRYADAEPLLRDALAVKRKTLGDAHPDTASGINSLAQLYSDQGRYADAEPLYRAALTARRKSLGDAHPATANSLNNLAAMYYQQGRLADAEPLFEEALAVYRKVLGDAHPTTANTLNNLASVYSEQGRYADAEPLFKVALATNRKTFGDAHPAAAACMVNLGWLYSDQGRYADAEPLFKDALAIRRKAFGDAHPDTATSLNGLAGLYKAQGRYADAEPLVRAALDATRKTFGDAHPTTARSRTNLAVLYRDQGRLADAEPYARSAVRAAADHLDATAAVQSEAAQLANLAVSRPHINTFLACTATADPASAYDLILRWQGAVTARQTFARAGRSVDLAAAVLLAALTDVSRRYATLVNNPPPPEQKVDVPARLKELSAARDDLETKLAATSAGFDKYVKNRGLTTADLRTALPPDAVLVNYIEYGKKLAAFVVRKDGITRVELGDAAPVAAAADALRATLTRRPIADGPAATLRKLVWEPLAKSIGGASTVLVCPDGPLCRVPFAALPGTDPAKYLIEELAVAVVPVPRLLPDLLVFRPADGQPALLVVGDVAFDAAPTLVASNTTGDSWKRVRAGGPRAWDRLPGTAAELDALATAFRAAAPAGRVTALRADAATEAAVRDQLAGSRFVHLATHGYFAPPAPAAPRKDGPLALDGPPRPAGPNPGLLCGVVLAGANKPKGEDDGVLTALEVGDLDLSGVELAVLSACETGLGETAGGEGVLGLQRAFQVAGARTTVTTLWQIPDAATQKLMARFYDNLWGKKLGKLAALREAQVWMLRDGAADPGVKRGLVRADDEPSPAAGDGRLPPFYWAAFTLAGDWR